MLLTFKLHFQTIYKSCRCYGYFTSFKTLSSFNLFGPKHRYDCDDSIGIVNWENVASYGNVFVGENWASYISEAVEVSDKDEEAKQ